MLPEASLISYTTVAPPSGLQDISKSVCSPWLVLKNRFHQHIVDRSGPVHHGAFCHIRRPPISKLMLASPVSRQHPAVLQTSSNNSRGPSSRMCKGRDSCFN